MTEMSGSGWRLLSVIKRYGLSVLSVATALLATSLLLNPSRRITPLFFPAIILSTWFGGTGPGLLAVLLSALSINYFFLHSQRTLAIGIQDLPYLTAFLVSALLVSSWSAVRRRTEDDLRRARNELEVRVAERTAELSQSNEQLRTEIAERKRVEETLREQASLLNLTHDAIFVFELDGVIKFWNRGAEEQYGWNAEQVVSRVIHDLLKTVSPLPLKQIKAALLGAGHWEGELIHTKRDGTPVVVASRWALQRDEQGNPVAILETNNDITERKRAEEERERVRRLQAELAHIDRINMLGELAASLAHELNQPIAAAITSAGAALRWLDREQPEVGRAREAVVRIEHDGRRAADIINRLRAFYKKETPIERQSVALNEVAREMMALLGSEADRHAVSLRAELAPALPPVKADRVQLQQVLMNLMLNAIEAMRGASGELIIKSEPGDGHVLVSVSDTGPGLPPGQTDELFNTFFTTKPDGTGMGLAISRSIVEAHGGRLWATNNDGRGASFYFTLPIHVEEHP